MISPAHVVAGAITALVFWTALGVPVLRRVLHPSLVLPFAPLAGWALHSVVALPVFYFVPFAPTTIAVVALVALAAAWMLSTVRRSRRPFFDASEPSSTVRVSAWAWAGAVVVAATCAAAILPKQVGDAVLLSDQIFDHAKVSMVDEMARLGLPPGNPFFADAGSVRLTYYYLLHFSAAELARLFSTSGWEADIAMTFFAAFTSLAAMMGLAVRYAGRASASVCVVVLAASSTSRPVLEWLVGGATLEAWLPQPGGWGGWFYQAPWVPQHLISTSCVLLSIVMIERVATGRGIAAIVVLAVAMAAGFESSTWVGGIVFPLVAAVVVPIAIGRADRGRRLASVAALAGAAALALLLVAPFIVDQAHASALRHDGLPLTIRAFDVLGTAIPEALRDALDWPAWWLVFLPLALPATFVPAVAVMFRSLRPRADPASGAVAIRPLLAAGLVALTASWLLVSTIADNNDLGWRAGLLGATIVTVFAAIGLASWVAERRRLACALAVLAIAIGLPEAVVQVERNVEGTERPDDLAFAGQPALWRAVRARTGVAERVASNPESMSRMTPWPVNIGWSLLADRRSCYAGWELAQVFTTVPHPRLREIDRQFIRVFGGAALPNDVEQLAVDYRCDVAVLTPQDGAWSNDPFRDSASYRLVDEDPKRWRIYRRRDAGDVPPRSSRDDADAIRQAGTRAGRE